MIKKLTLIVGVGAGYVLGSKAGRQRYDEIVAQVQKLTRTPQAQKVAGTLQEAAGDLVDKATTAAAGANSDSTIDLTARPTTAPVTGLPTAALTTTTTAPAAGSAAHTTR